MDKMLISYGAKIHLKSGKELDVTCVYDGVEFPFYYFSKEDGSQYSFLLDGIEYIEFSAERAIQIEERKQQQQLKEGGEQC